MNEWLSIRKEVSPRVRWTLAFVSWGFLVALWIVLTHWEILPPFSLPKPMGVIRAFARLWTEYDLLGNVFQSWWRIAQAFFWCAVVAIPLGILMASFRWLFELINPVAAPMRAMPLTAFLPAFIALFGMDETMKVAFLWFGMFFYLLAVVVAFLFRFLLTFLERKLFPWRQASAPLAGAAAAVPSATAHLKAAKHGA